uniref:Uncharacterized protein n=1 Tax=Anguilla anguilla TaxID=7936 RepID=A0A0E9QG82_ANGAN
MADEPKTKYGVHIQHCSHCLPVVYPMTAPELNAHAVV